MALAIGIFSETGILLASDSRLLCLAQTKGEENPQIMVNRRAQLTYHCSNRVGLSFVSPAVIQGRSAEAMVQAFVTERIRPETSIEDIQWMLLNDFSEKEELAEICFLVAGYQGKEQKLIKVNCGKKTCENINTKRGGVTWIGEGALLTRLFMRCGVEKTPDRWMPLPSNRVAWSLMSQRSSMELAESIFNISSTLASLSAGVASVGEVSDMLLIEPQGAAWYKKSSRVIDNFGKEEKGWGTI